MTKTSPAPGAGLAVASSFNLDKGGDPPSLLLSYLLLGSHCLGVVKGRRRRVRSCWLLYSCAWNSQAKEVLLLLFLFLLSCDHAQSGLHHFSDRLSKRLLCDLFLLPITIMKWKRIQTHREGVTIASNIKLITHYLCSRE